MATTTKTTEDKGEWRNLTADEVKACFGAECHTAFESLMKANKVAGDARKALQTIVAAKAGVLPKGKKLVTSAKFGKLSIGIVNGEADIVTAAKTSISDWLAAQSA